MGIFYRLFQLLEDECHQLDRAVRDERDSEKGGPTYMNYMDDFARARTLRDELDRLFTCINDKYVFILSEHNYKANDEVAQLNELVALLVVFAEGEEEDDPELRALRSEIEEKARQAKKLVSTKSYTTCQSY